MQFGLEAGPGDGGETLRHAHVDAQFAGVGDAKQLRCRRSVPALIKAPMSVLRTVITPANGATTRLNDSSSRSRPTLAAAESAAAFFAAASPAFSSASCLDTDCVDNSPCQRILVLLDSASLARAVASSAWAWVNC